MRRVILETRSGDRVCEALMAPFKVNPEVVVWGTRVFKLHSDDPTEPVYREVFCAAVATIDQLEMP